MFINNYSVYKNGTIRVSWPKKTVPVPETKRTMLTIRPLNIKFKKSVKWSVDYKKGRIPDIKWWGLNSSVYIYYCQPQLKNLTGHS